MKKNKNLRITIFIGGLGGGGAERVVCNLANYLAKKEWNICILTMFGRESSYPLHSNIKIHSLIEQQERKNFLYNFILRYLRLKEYVKTEKTDCFIVMLPVTTIMLLSLRSKFKVIVSERSNPARYSKVIQCLLKVLAHKADGYVFQTKDILEWYLPYIKEKQTIVIPNAVNEEFIVNNKLVPEKRIIAVGRLTKVKNFELLIKAYSNIADKYPDYKVYIFGDGPERNNLENLARKLKVDKNIVISKFTNDIKEELQRSKVFVMSSDYEGMPNALIEAMALGLPCIATDCEGGGAKFLIQENVNGFLVPVGNDKQMAQYIDLILSSEELAYNIGQKAQEIAITLNPDKVYSIWKEFIESVVFK